jgi:hypothetical protein
MILRREEGEEEEEEEVEISKARNNIITWLPGSENSRDGDSRKC